MLQVLTHNILPVFAMLALGFALGRMNWATQDEARAVNRIAFLVLQPPLIYMLLTSLDMASIRFDAIALYFAAEVILFLVAFALARFGFRCDSGEAFLLAMCVVFVNSLLYVGPISVLIYGAAGALPITVIVALDASVWFAFFIIGMELITGQEGAKAALPRIVKNPVLITIVLALAINLAAIPTPVPLQNAFQFAGAAAAPMVLFALGVVLSSHSFSATAPVVGISALKLLGLPLVVWSAFQVFSPENPWSGLFTMNASGPAGAMAFSLAMLYGVRTDRIAPVIICTSVLSLFSLAYLA
ncbi:MAG: malonate transporter [Silicimonas sp.]|nr:malonate transporter [Silicimonas sp.]